MQRLIRTRPRHNITTRRVVGPSELAENLVPVAQFSRQVSSVSSREGLRPRLRCSSWSPIRFGCGACMLWVQTSPPARRSCRLRRGRAFQGRARLALTLWFSRYVHTCLAHSTPRAQSLLCSFFWDRRFTFFLFFFFSACVSLLERKLSSLRCSWCLFTAVPRGGNVFLFF